VQLVSTVPRMDGEGHAQRLIGLLAPQAKA
jgi:hypothetical protein